MRVEKDSQPESLDILERKILQLDIEVCRFVNTVTAERADADLMSRLRHWRGKQKMPV